MLTRQQRNEMRALYVSGEKNLSELAEQFGVTRQAVQDFKTREKWDLLAQEHDKRFIEESFQIELEIRYKTIAMIDRLLDKLDSRLLDDEVPNKEIKALYETRKMAYDELMNYLSRKEKDEIGSILDELIKL